MGPGTYKSANSETLIVVARASLPLPQVCRMGIREVKLRLLQASLKRPDTYHNTHKPDRAFQYQAFHGICMSKKPLYGRKSSTASYA